MPRFQPDAEPAPQRISLSEALVVLGIARFRALLIAGGVLALATANDAFIFLILQDELDLSLGLFPLLFVAMTALARPTRAAALRWMPSTKPKGGAGEHPPT